MSRRQSWRAATRRPIRTMFERSVRAACGFDVDIRAAVDCQSGSRKQWTQSHRAWSLREAILRAARSDEALPTAPDRARTTHVAGVSRSWSKSELLLRFPIFFLHPPGGTPCSASTHIIGQHLSRRADL